MGSLFSAAEDAAAEDAPAAWRLGGDREERMRRTNEDKGGAVRWACRVDAARPAHGAAFVFVRPSHSFFTVAAEAPRRRCVLRSRVLCSRKEAAHGLVSGPVTSWLPRAARVVCRHGFVVGAALRACKVVGASRAARKLRLPGILVPYWPLAPWERSVPTQKSPCDTTFVQIGLCCDGCEA